MATKVMFRYWENSVIALFPELSGDRMDTCLSYQHIGQHGVAGINDFIADSRPATEAEYLSLKSELESFGYKLRIVSRYTYAMQRKRTEATRERFKADCKPVLD